MFNWMDFDKIAASRNKRQQLDHLLTVTVPRERLMLATVVLLLLLLPVYALFGRVAHGFTADGVLIGSESAGEPAPARAELRVGPDLARRVQPGMRAWVSLAAPSGGGGVLRGEVAVVAAEVGGALHRIEVALRGLPSPIAPAGAPCRVRIILDRVPPIALFAGRVAEG
ncbi:MAG: hypothetical protein OXF82_02840 [Gammaproteobacteria bacterium]|nr:hypothetical protein [Gammaproteobacteria bacterium]